MKTKKRRVLVLWTALISLLFLATGSPVAGQETITLTPSQLNIAAIQGQSVSRTLVIRASEEMAAIEIVPMVLAGAQDGDNFPTDFIEIGLETDNLPANGILSVPLRFNLARVEPGQYNGQLLINYRGGSRSLPVRMSVKAPPWLPLVVLVLGVALGIAVSAYRARGRPRDEAMVRLGQIRTQMKVDEELRDLGTPFMRRIESELADAEVALEGQQWDRAQEAIQRADEIWARWRSGRPDWIVQLKAYHQFIQRLEEIGADIHYIAELQMAAEDAYQEIPELEEPQRFKAELSPLREKTNAYLELNARIEMLRHHSAHGAAQAEVFLRQLRHLSPQSPQSDEVYDNLRHQVDSTLLRQRKLELMALLATYRERLSAEPPSGDLPEPEQFKERIDSLPTEADSAYLDLQQELTVAIQGLTPPTAESTILESSGALRSGAGAGAVAKGLPQLVTPQLLTRLPEVRVRSLEEQTIVAGRRLRWFAWLTYGTAVILLALAGFVELYATRPNFGANGAADYFALLAWGFGAEATRSAISDMVQSWGFVRQ
ncbi:MAG: hypothetical protein ACP5JG_11835 [Anaerolineae bacterium]